MTPDDPPDRPRTVATIGRVAVMHTAKCCTNTVARKLCPPMERPMIDDVPEGAIFIGLVRHPIDRFVSCYSDTTRPHRIFLIETNRYTHAPIPGTYAGMPIEALADVVERYPCANAHWVPQARWLSWRGSLPDHVVRYETLYDDWAGLRHRYPELPPFPAERLNASPRGRWEIVVPPGALREQLVRVYREDFEVFGYPIP